MPLPVVLAVIFLSVVCGGAVFALLFFVIRRRKRVKRTAEEQKKSKKAAGNRVAARPRSAPSVKKAEKEPAKEPVKAKKDAGLKSPPAKPAAEKKPPVKSATAKRAAAKPAAGTKKAAAEDSAEKTVQRGRPIDYHKDVPTVRVDTIFAPAAVEKPLTASKIDAASRRSQASLAESDQAAPDSTSGKTVGRKTDPETVVLTPEKPTKSRKTKA